MDTRCAKTATRLSVSVQLAKAHPQRRGIAGWKKLLEMLFSVHSQKLDALNLLSEMSINYMNRNAILGK
jgi:hypothetical protein